MSRTEGFLINIVVTAIMQIVSVLVNFILPRVMLTYYGSEINGLVSSITQFINCFTFVEIGLSGAAIHSLYKPLADKNHKVINAIVTAAKNFYTLSGYIFVMLVVGLATIYPFFVRTENLSPIFVGLLVLVLGTSGILEFFTLSKYRVLLAADQKNYVISIASICAMILNVIIIIILSRLGVNVVLMRFAALSSVFLRTIILYCYCKREYRFLDYSVEPDNSALEQRWDAFIQQIFGVVQGIVPVMLTTLLTNLKTVSVYSIFNVVNSGLNAILSVFTTGIHAAFGDVIAKNQLNVLQKAYKEFECAYYTLITVLYSVAMIMIMPFIRIYTANVTDANYNIPLYGVLFVIRGLLHNIQIPQEMLVGSAGVYRDIKNHTLMQSLTGIVFEALLGFKFGLSGIIIGSFVSYLYRDIYLVLFMSRNVTRLNPIYSFLKMLRVIVLVIISMIISYKLDLTADNYIEWIIKALSVGAVAFIISMLSSIIFEFGNVKNLYIRIKKLIFKKR